MELMAKEDVYKRQFQRYMRDYMKTVKALDYNVGRVLDYLKEKNMLDNTLVLSLIHIL